VFFLGKKTPSCQHKLRQGFFLQNKREALTSIGKGRQSIFL
jgi:hypothetical protein